MRYKRGYTHVNQIWNDLRKCKSKYEIDEVIKNIPNSFGVWLAEEEKTGILITNVIGEFEKEEKELIEFDIKKIMLSDVLNISNEFKKNGIDCGDSEYDYDSYFCMNGGYQKPDTSYKKFLEYMSENIEVVDIGRKRMLLDTSTFVANNKEKLETFFRDSINDEEEAIESIFTMISGNDSERYYNEFLRILEEKKEVDIKESGEKVFLIDLISISKDYRANGIDVFDEKYDYGCAFIVAPDFKPRNPYNMFIKYLADNLQVKDINSNRLLLNITDFAINNKEKFEELFGIEFEEEAIVENIVLMISGEAENYYYDDFVNSFIYENEKQEEEEESI